MSRIRFGRGLSTVELIIAVAVAATIGYALLSTFAVWRTQSTITDTHNEADVYLTALHEYYWRYCQITPFPQPSYLLLKDTDILIHDVAPNPISNTEFVPSIQWPGTNRATSVLTLQFPDAESAFRVAAASREAEQTGNEVVWRRSLSRLNSAHSGFKNHTETEIFAPNRCQV